MKIRIYKFDSINDVEICREYFGKDAIDWDKIEKTVTVRWNEDCPQYESQQWIIHGWNE